MRIRPALPSDRAQVVEIWLASVRATHAFLSEADIQALLPLVRERALPSLELWVLAEGDAVIGFSGLDGARLEALFIHPDHTGKGGGRMMVDHARRLKGRLLVDVNEPNPDALRFYESVGFEGFGRSVTDAGGRPFPLLHMKEIDPGR
jgi:putative acetyltransferase